MPTTNDPSTSAPLSTTRSNRPRPRHGPPACRLAFFFCSFVSGAAERSVKSPPPTEAGGKASQSAPSAVPIASAELEQPP